ncbi:MAG: RES family NAD+ phosphorylase [Wenzhouxiangellaceae bacterium]
MDDQTVIIPPQSHITRIRARPWRAVESQHQVVTRKLVDSYEEHTVLEALLEQSKPPSNESSDLHYLLTTPFRYPPLRYGSRFGQRHQRGIWYGSQRISTVLSEVAYYRLRFIAGTSADLGAVTASFTLFQTRIDSDRGIDLCSPPYAQHQKRWSDPASYRDSQAMGTAMRDAQVEMFRFTSARDPRGGANYGLFSATAFIVNRPIASATWHSVSRHVGVEFRHSIDRISRWYPRELFCIDGVLPLPGS